MGEIAEMMLEGYLCEETGEVIDGTSPGYPRRLSDGAAREHISRYRKLRRTIQCPGCNRKFGNKFALSQHRAAKEH